MKLIWFRTPYFGSKGESLTRSCINKLRRFCINDTKIVFKVLYDTKKFSYFTNNKDPTSELDLRSFQITLVTNDLKIIDQHLNGNVLLFKEATVINRFHSNLNNGLKASKELQLF